MAWTAPRTYVVNEVLTASIFNTDHRNNQLALLHPYHSESADKDVVSTVTETTLFDTAPVITGNDLGANGRLLVEVEGGCLYNNSVSDTIRLRVKFGGTTVIDD